MRNPRKKQPGAHPLRRIRTALANFINNREKGLIGRQRLAVYFYSTSIVVVGVLLNLTGATGPAEPVYRLLNTAHLLAALFLFAGYYVRKIPLTAAWGTLAMATQLEISAEMLVAAIHLTSYGMMLIVANMVLISILIMLTLIAYMRYIPWLLCLTTLGTYIACAAITGNPSMWNFALLFVLIFVLITLLGGRLVKNIRQLERENKVLREDEHAMLEMLRLNKEQMMAFVELSKGDTDNTRAAELFEKIGTEARRNLFLSAKERIDRERTQEEIMARMFPELSPSEREICSLILREKKQTEICALLGKTPGNITSQRTHIREKLRLGKEENLRAALLKRMKQLQRADEVANEKPAGDNSAQRE